MYPRARLDALSDAVFGVAMTLLVLDVRLPEDFHTDDANELLRALGWLLDKFWPYVLSFVVLGLRWLGNIQVRSRGELVGREYVNWWLLYLLLITCVPFTTIIIGHFGTLAPAIWLYAGNTALIALVAFRLMALTPDIERDHHLRARKLQLILLIVSSLLAIALSFVTPWAPWIMFLNFGAPALTRWKYQSS